VAFAGFSALVSMLGHKPDSDNPRADLFRLRVLVETAMIVAGFSLLPVIVANFKLSALWVWQVPAMGCVAIGAVGSVINAMRLKGGGPLSSRQDKFTFVVIWPMDSLQYLFLLVVMLGAFPQHTAAAYSAAMFLNLAVRDVMFV